MSLIPLFLLYHILLTMIAPNPQTRQTTAPTTNGITHCSCPFLGAENNTKKKIRKPQTDTHADTLFLPLDYLFSRHSVH